MVVLDGRCQEPERREDARSLRHQYLADAKLFC